jgi:hypothetical protein
MKRKCPASSFFGIGAPFLISDPSLAMSDQHSDIDAPPL